jgi:flagella basal body P-ring formation protein FlgA
MSKIMKSTIMKSGLALAAVAFLAASPAHAEPAQDVANAPSLRASAVIMSDVVRIGDLVDNAGTAAQVAIYRAPDLGTTGTLRTAQLIETLRANQVIGVDTHNLKEVAITRASRSLEATEVEQQVAKAIARRRGIGDAANLSLTFDRELRDLQLDPSLGGDLIPVATYYDARSGRFDVSFDIASDASSTPAKLRFTGTAIETVAATVLMRPVERNEVLKASDVSMERRPKAEVGSDGISLERAIGMQMRRAMRSGQALRTSDLAKADLVTRDQAITLIYEAPGIYLTGRGKALEAGTKGDTVNILNLQSKRTIQGTVVGPGQVAIIAPMPRTAQPATLAANTATAGKIE